MVVLSLYLYTQRKFYIFNEITDTVSEYQGGLV